MTYDDVSSNTAASSTDDLVVPVPPASLFDKVPWLVRPSPGINYDFVAMMYLSGSALAILFFLLERQLLTPLLADDDQLANSTYASAGESDDVEGDGVDAWKEFARGVQGMHFIFDPFIPCLFWSLIVRYYWLKETKSVLQDKKEN